MMIQLTIKAMAGCSYAAAAGMPRRLRQHKDVLSKAAKQEFPYPGLSPLKPHRNINEISQ
jgi:hypothetical protein